MCATVNVSSPTGHIVYVGTGYGTYWSKTLLGNGTINDKMVNSIGMMENIFFCVMLMLLS